MTKCARTVRNREALHTHSHTGNKYCTACARTINEFCGEVIVPFDPKAVQKKEWNLLLSQFILFLQTQGIDFCVYEFGMDEPDILTPERIYELRDKFMEQIPD